MAASREQLKLRSAIGFAGHVPGGLILHPDESRVIYPLGNTIVTKTLLKQGSEQFLTGHRSPINCVCMNKEGTLLATGEKSNVGFPAQIIVWDLETMKLKYRLDLHKGSIQSLSFSKTSEYLASLGGEDDNKIVCWNMLTGQSMMGSPAHNETAKTVVFYNNDNETLVTAGKYHVRTWQIDRKSNKIRPTDCKLGQVKRVVNTVCIDENDEYIYAGTGSGDVLCINAKSKLFTRIGPLKKQFSGGIQTLKPCTFEGKECLLVGSGLGCVALLTSDRLRVKRRLQLDGSIQSICLNQLGNHFFVGTSRGNMYCVALSDFEYELRQSSHYDKINSVAFPPNFSNLFVTASKNDIRVWNLQTTHELLRIQIPNCNCLCVVVSHDGKQIISGWSDGKIRAFLPQSGRLLYTINDAHLGNVRTIRILSDGERLISGGDDGKVRVWDVSSLEAQTLIVSWKEHHCKVYSLEVNSEENKVVSSSGDGSCIIWDLIEYKRLNALFAQNQFTQVLYHPDQSQLLTTGTDRKISWWDATELDTIREIEGSESAVINALAISGDGESFVSAGADYIVNFWKYDDGEITHEGSGHSSPVTSVMISPDNKHIVSVGEEGGIFIWEFPSADIKSIN